MVSNLTTTCALIKNDISIIKRDFREFCKILKFFSKRLIQNERITKIANCGRPQKMNFWASKPVKFKFLATKPVFSFVFTKIEFSNHHNLEMSDDVTIFCDVMNFFIL